MADFYKIEIKSNELDRLYADLPKVTKAATAQALNVVARKVNSELKKSISERYNVPKSAMKFGKLVSIKRADARRDIGKAIIFIRKQGRGLVKYGAEQVATGISVTVKTAAKVIKGGFISPLRKGDSGKFAFKKATGKHAGKVTRRSAAGKPYQADKRQILYGPQIAQLYTNKHAEKVILKVIDEKFQPELDKQFNAKFEKKGRR